MSFDDGASAIREVDQELEEDQQIRELKKNLPFIIGLAALVIVIVAGRQFWMARQASIAETNAVAFSEAVELSEADPVAGLAALDVLVEDGPTGYGAMAAFRAGSLASQAGERGKAISYFLKVAEDGEAEKRLRDLARIKAAHMALEDDRDRALQILNGLETQNTPLGRYAREVAGLAAMQVKDYAGAKTYFDQLLADPATPEPLLRRAREMAALSHLGAEGVDLSLKQGANSQDLLNLVEQAGAAAGRACAGG